MSLENIPEQPHASSKPPSDFNDLHVIAGLDEVGRQIQEAVSTIHLTVVDSPTPLIMPTSTWVKWSKMVQKIGLHHRKK